MRLIFPILLLLASCAPFLPSPDKAAEKKDPISSVKVGSGKEIKVFHYNIQELTTGKLLDPKNKQVQAAKLIIDNHRFDILSINEIQYDLPGVPALEFTSQGENLTRLKKSLGLSSTGWSQIFAPANTGTRARRNEDGAYYVEQSSVAREHADPLNFGLFPAQYSTGGLIRGRINEKIIINELRWREFNPHAKPENYSLFDGRPLPQDIVLFDKNFNHAITTFHGRTFHVIFLHAVPSYHFGIQNTPNYERNADQLRFLEWYVTGETEFEVPLNRKRWPVIEENDIVIVVGDLNADVNQNNPGSIVLKRLMTKLQPWMNKLEPTSESYGFAPNPTELYLDYILVSKNVDITEAGVIRPKASPIYLGCDPATVKRLRPRLRAGREIVEYFDTKKQTTCYATVSQSYYDAKTASDHFPIYATLKVK